MIQEQAVETFPLITPKFRRAVQETWVWERMHEDNSVSKVAYISCTSGAISCMSRHTVRRRLEAVCNRIKLNYQDRPWLSTTTKELRENEAASKRGCSRC